RALTALSRVVQDSQQAPQPHTLVKAQLPSICRRPGESSYPGPARALLGPGQQCRCRLLKLIMSSDQPRTDATCHGAIADPFQDAQCQLLRVASQHLQVLAAGAVDVSWLLCQSFIKVGQFSLKPFKQAVQFFYFGGIDTLL